MEKLFKLKPDFLADYKNKRPDWGPIGEFVYYRTYSREQENGTQETWVETLQRVVEGTYNTQINWFTQNNLFRKNWNWHKAQKSAQTMFDLFYNFKCLPPGRGLWTMGTEIIEKKGAACLSNCAFISTEKITVDFARPFTFMVDMSMLGVGVGFDTEGADKVRITKTPRTTKKPFIVEDSREGWVALISQVIMSMINRAEFPLIRDYSGVRGKGAKIITFGGISSGPLPLEILIQDLISIFGFYMPTEMHYVTDKPDIEYSISRELKFDPKQNPLLNSVKLVDLLNSEGKCVVSGNVRRTAQAVIGNSDDWAFINMKDIFQNSFAADIKKVKEISNTYPIPQYAINHLKETKNLTINDYKIFGPYSWRWVSNDSIKAYQGMDYSPYVDKLVITGAPGFFWIKNAQDYSRMIDPPDYKDKKAKGSNPCLEQTLESDESCLLVEDYLSRCNSYEEFIKATKSAYLYGKTITLLPTHDETTNAILLKNRRIGTGVTGVTAAIAKNGFATTKQWLNDGYKYINNLDEIYSDWFCIPRSRKMTTVKPSGTISKLPPSIPPGAHFPLYQYGITRIRVADNSPLLEIYKKAGYRTEQDIYDKTAYCIEFPIHNKNFVKSEKDTTIWEQFMVAKLLQQYWSDNQVSITIKFKPHEIDDIKTALPMFEDCLKSVSFLPLKAEYEQMPNEAISKHEYEQRSKLINRVDLIKELTHNKTHEADDKFCDGEACTIAQ